MIYFATVSLKDLLMHQKKNTSAIWNNQLRKTKPLDTSSLACLRHTDSTYRNKNNKDEQITKEDKYLIQRMHCKYRPVMSFHCLKQKRILPDENVSSSSTREN